MSKIQVVGLGALNIDHLYRVERILDDEEAVVNEAKSFPGVSAANTIYGLAKLGVNTGAGDAFTVGFLYGLLKGKGLNQCGCLGDIAARFSLTRSGARESLSILIELAQRYHELYNQQL